MAMLHCDTTGFAAVLCKVSQDEVNRKERGRTHNGMKVTGNSVCLLMEGKKKSQAADRDG